MAESRNFTPREKYPDRQIAAIAMSRKIPIARRNIRDVRHKGLEIINPSATPRTDKTAVLQGQAFSIRQIAATLDRSPSTIFES